MFENFINDVNKNATPKELVNVNIMDSPVFDTRVIYEKLANIDKQTDRELFNLLKLSYGNLLKDIFEKDNPIYLPILVNTKFLTIFIQVMSNVPITYEQRVYCNKIAYDYLTSSNKDNYIMQLYYSLSKVVNRDIIPALLGLGIPEDLASYMALARYSSLKEMVNVKRLNFILISSSISLMNEQTIIWIYEKLFDRVTPLFEGVMFDVLSEEDEEQYTDDMSEIYSTISLAILDIMNAMPSQDIRKVLISYVGDYELLYRNINKKSIRFSLRSLSSDYQRIIDVIEALSVEGIYVP